MPIKYPYFPFEKLALGMYLAFFLVIVPAVGYIENLLLRPILCENYVSKNVIKK